MHALNSEHAQGYLWLLGIDYWLELFGLNYYCVGMLSIGKSLFSD